MEKRVQKVVGVAFIKDGKLLIVQSVKSSKTNSWTFVGGGVEDGENILDAAIREVSEEIRNGFTIEADDLAFVMRFTEAAASDPNLTIEMNVMHCKKDVDVELIPNEEILRFHWLDKDEVEYNVSSSIKEHFLPLAVERGMMY